MSQAHHLRASAPEFAPIRALTEKAVPFHTEALGAANYRPHPRDWRWLPEDLLLIKDTLHDVAHAAIDKTMQLSLFRAAWMRLGGKALQRRIERGGCLQIHIPRTGGTSLSRLLYGRNLPHHTAQHWSLLFGPQFQGWCRFAIVRDPVERFLSAYRFTLQGGNELILNSRYEMALLAPMQPFAAFLDRMERRPHRLKRVPVFRPQVDFLKDVNGRLMIDRLFAIDEPSLGDARLSTWLGVRALPRLNASDDCGLIVGQAERERIKALYEEDALLHDRIIAAGGEIAISPTIRNVVALRTAA